MFPAGFPTCIKLQSEKAPAPVSLVSLLLLRAQQRAKAPPTSPPPLISPEIRFEPNSIWTLCQKGLLRGHPAYNLSLWQGQFSLFFWIVQIAFGKPVDKKPLGSNFCQSLKMAPRPKANSVCGASFGKSRGARAERQAEASPTFYSVWTLLSVAAQPVTISINQIF